MTVKKDKSKRVLIPAQIQKAHRFVPGEGLGHWSDPTDGTGLRIAAKQDYRLVNSEEMRHTQL